MMNLMAELNRAISYEQALQTAKKAKLKVLGQGSTRMVFALDAHRVLKVAINEEGVDQNEAESDLSEAPVTTKVLEMHEEAYWIIAERAIPLENNADIFLKLVGVPFGTFAKYTMKKLDIADFKVPEKDEQRLQMSPFFKQLMRYITSHGLAAGDATKLTSFGVVGNHIVLIDYGLTALHADLF
jgi:hypothetical protein